MKAVIWENNILRKTINCCISKKLSHYLNDYSKKLAWLFYIDLILIVILLHKSYNSLKQERAFALPHEIC